MKGQELKIIFKEDLAFLTEEVALDFKQVEIYNGPAKFKAPAFWTIRVINYIKEEKRLFVEVLSYHVGETTFSDHQIQMADSLNDVEKVTFKSIDTSCLFKTLNSTQPVKLYPPKQEIVYREETFTQPETKIKREPIVQIYNEPFSIPIKNVTFISGGVTFEKKIQQHNKPIKFKIPNEHIIEEYDSIKNYFANVLNAKKIQVTPTVTITDNEITSTIASSIEIEKIDKTFIEEVKFEIIRGTRRKESIGDRQLFTMDEYLETFVDDEIKTQGIFKDENAFIETILEKSGTKHYKHLRFLSSKHKADLQKLRFINNPFSFIFLLSGIEHLHIVWETLDTQEATYIWTISNSIQDLKQAFAHIEKTINLIMKDGKNEYINQKAQNFNRVFHDYKDLQNGFKDWKEEIEKVILL